MSVGYLFLIPLLLGHVSCFVFLFNIAHALGHPSNFLRWFKIIGLGVFMLGSGVLAYESWLGAIAAWSWPSLIYGMGCVVVGGFALPATTALLRRRPQPEGIEGRAEALDLLEREGMEALRGQGRHNWMLALPGNESFRLTTLDCQIQIPALPASLDGLSLLHFSDLHLATAFSQRFFEAVLDEAASREADLVVFTGDLLDDDAAKKWIIPLMSRVRGRLGTFSILGNHDLDHHPEELAALLRAAGYTHLDGGWSTIEHGGARVAVAGTAYPWGRRVRMEERPDADVSILLSHAPDQYYWASKNRFDLMLSGHNHGGQVRLPVVGPVFMPSVYSRRFDRGFFRRGGLTLHVSQGIAGQHPLRYGCPPEICRLVLRSVRQPLPAAGHRHLEQFAGQQAGRA